jgi:hypothetical protein
MDNVHQDFSSQNQAKEGRSYRNDNLGGEKGPHHGIGRPGSYPEGMKGQSAALPHQHQTPAQTDKGNEDVGHGLPLSTESFV